MAVYATPKHLRFPLNRNYHYTPYESDPCFIADIEIKTETDWLEKVEEGESQRKLCF